MAHPTHPTHPTSAPSSEPGDLRARGAEPWLPVKLGTLILKAGAWCVKCELVTLSNVHGLLCSPSQEGELLNYWLRCVSVLNVVASFHLKFKPNPAASLLVAAVLEGTGSSVVCPLQTIAGTRIC